MGKINESFNFFNLLRKMEKYGLSKRSEDDRLRIFLNIFSTPPKSNDLRPYFDQISSIITGKVALKKYLNGHFAGKLPEDDSNKKHLEKLMSYFLKNDGSLNEKNLNAFDRIVNESLGGYKIELSDDFYSNDMFSELTEFVSTHKDRSQSTNIAILIVLSLFPEIRSSEAERYPLYRAFVRRSVHRELVYSTLSPQCTLDSLYREISEIISSRTRHEKRPAKQIIDDHVNGSREKILFEHQDIRSLAVKALVLMAYEDYSRDFKNRELLEKVIKETTAGKELVDWANADSDTYFEGLELCYFKLSAHWRERDYTSMGHELNELKKEMRRNDNTKDKKYWLLNSLFTKMDAIYDNNCMKWESAVDKYTILANMQDIGIMQQSTSYNNLAIVYRYGMRPDCAAIHYKNAMEMRNKVFSLRSTRMSLVLTNYAITLAFCKLFEKAHEYNNTALEVRRDSYIHKPSDIARAEYHSSLMNDAYIYLCELIYHLDSQGGCELSLLLKNKDSTAKQLIEKAEDALSKASDEKDGLLFNSVSRPADDLYFNYYMICSEYLYFKAFGDISLLDKCSELLGKANEIFEKSQKCKYDELRDALCSFYTGRVKYRYAVSQNDEYMLYESLKCILKASDKIENKLFYYDNDSEYHSYYLGVSYFMYAAVIQLIQDKGNMELLERFDINDPEAETNDYLKKAREEIEQCTQTSAGRSSLYVKYENFNRAAFGRELNIIESFIKLSKNSDEDSLKQKEELFTGFYIDIPKK